MELGLVFVIFKKIIIVSLFRMMCVKYHKDVCEKVLMNLW